MSQRKPTPREAIAAASGLFAFGCAGLGMRWHGALWGVIIFGILWLLLSPGALLGALLGALGIGGR